MDAPAEQIIRRPRVRELTGKSDAAIYRGMERGDFPRSVVLGPNSRGWLLSEILAYINSMKAARDAGMDAAQRIPNKNIGRGRPKKLQQITAKDDGAARAGQKHATRRRTDTEQPTRQAA